LGKKGEGKKRGVGRILKALALKEMIKKREKGN